MFIYFEPQVSQLCGLHCINNVAQGPIFDPGLLADIAHRLESQEIALIGPRAADEESPYVDATGNFSVDVLSEALKGQLGLTLTSLDAPRMIDIRSTPTNASCFVCNHGEHWLCIRSINGNWWDLNSLNTYPKRIGELHLGLYLHQLMNEGYDIFVVEGPLPAPASTKPDVAPEIQRRYFDEATLLSIGFGAQEVSGDTSGASEDDELARVLALSKQEFEANTRQDPAPIPTTGSSFGTASRIHGFGDSSATSTPASATPSAATPSAAGRSLREAGAASTVASAPTGTVSIDAQRRQAREARLRYFEKNASSGGAETTDADGGTAAAAVSDVVPSTGSDVVPSTGPDLSAAAQSNTTIAEDGEDADLARAIALSLQEQG